MENNETQQMDLRRVLEIVVRRRLLVGITTAMVFCATVVLCLIIPNTYEAASTVLINNKSIIDPIMSKLAVAPDPEDEINTLAKQVMSWSRLEQLILQLHMVPANASPQQMNEYINDLRKRISVEKRGRELVQVGFRDRKAVQAQLVVNTLTQNFIAENGRLNRKDARNAIDFIEGQLQIYQKKLEKSQTNFSVSKVASELRLLQNKRRLLVDKLQNLQKIIPSQITREQNPVIARLQTRLGEIETELARLMVDAREGNPKLNELRRQSIEIKAKIDAEKEKETVKESVSIMNPTYLQTEQDLKQTDLDMEYLLRRKIELDQQSGKSLKAVSEDELANLERSKKVDEDIYQVLLRQLESAYVSENLQDSDQGSRFTVIEYARLPLAPVSPKRVRMLFMGLVAGIALGIGLAFMIEQLDRSFKTIEEAKETLPLAYLGIVSRIVPEAPEVNTRWAALKKRYEEFMNRHQIFSHVRLVAPTVLKKTADLPVSPEIITVHQPLTMIMEEFRVLKSNITNALEEKTPVALIVTSSLKSEGKSTTAANLAVILAHSTVRTLLVDADMRRGRTHALFGVRQEPGLTDLLSESCTLKQALIPSGIEHLTLLPRGALSHQTYDLIGSNKMKQLVSSLKEQFDVIIFDTPPVLTLPDTPLISKCVDGVILVVQAERTQKKDVTNAYQALHQARAKILGFVLTNVQYYVPRSLYQYYYYSQY